MAAEHQTDVAPQRTDDITPAHPRSGGETVFVFAIAAAALAGLGGLFTIDDTLGSAITAIILCSLGILSGVIGLILGFSRHRRGPTIVAAACTTFAVLLLVLAVFRIADQRSEPEPAQSVVEEYDVYE